MTDVLSESQNELVEAAAPNRSARDVVAEWWPRLELTGSASDLFGET